MAKITGYMVCTQQIGKKNLNQEYWFRKKKFVKDKLLYFLILWESPQNL